MATPEDLKINAEYIREGDQYVEVPGGSNNHNYANVDLIVDIAERTGVHAVWAGWCVFPLILCIANSLQGPRIRKPSPSRLPRRQQKQNRLYRSPRLRNALPR